jgi:cytochrome c-type biogenesis protein CcmH
MIVFWLFAFVIAVVAAVVVVWPLLRYRPHRETSLLELNRRVFHERLQELEKDEKEGRIDAETLLELRTELERNLLTLDTTKEQDTVPARNLRWLAIVVLILLPVIAGSLYYFKIESSALPQWWQLRTEMGPVIDRMMQGGEPVADETKGRTLPDFIRVLQDRLQKKPDNANGWFMLGLSYAQLGMAASAQTAFEHAWRYGPDDPRNQVAYAQARIYSNEGRLDSTSRQLLQQVIAAQPKHEGALLLLGLSAYQSEDYPTTISALEHLQTLRAERHADVEVAELTSTLAAARAKLAQPKNQIDSQKNVAQMIRARVRVNRTLAGKYSPDDTVFVFARAMQGPPMPVAAAKRRAAELPFTVDLDDSSSVMPTLKLSVMKEVVVTARIARHGGPEAQPGDLEAIAVPVRLNGQAQDVELIISEIKK